MINAVACPVCLTSRYETEYEDASDYEYGASGKFNFIKCTTCGVMILSPQPSIEELLSYYPPDYHGYNSSSRGLISILYRVIDELRASRYAAISGPQGLILDIGCADAQYFDIIKSRFPGIKPVGIEFNDSVAEKGRRLNRNIITGTLRSARLDTDFNLIVMNNLIEHVLDPMAELKAAASLLKNNGSILVETPNTDCWDRAVFGRYWGGLHVPRHTFLFTPSSISALAEKVGLKVKSIKYPINTDHWALSFQNRLQNTSEFRASLKNGRTWYFKFLLFLMIPLNLIQKLLGKTGSMEVVLIKKGGACEA